MLRKTAVPFLISFALTGCAAMDVPVSAPVSTPDFSSAPSILPAMLEEKRTETAVIRAGITK